MKQIIQRVIDNLYQSHQQNNLNCQRDQGCQRIVLLSLEDLGLFVRDPVCIPEMFCLDPVDLRLHLYHFNGILLYPDGYRQQYDLADQCEQNDCQSIIMHQIIAKIHYISQRF